MDSNVLQWDYTNIGDISEYIVEDSGRTVNEFYIVDIRVANNDILPVMMEPYDSMAIACDKIKSYFGLFTVRYHIVNLGDENAKYLISMYQGDILLSEKYPNLTPNEICTPEEKLFMNEVKKCFAFQWLVGYGAFKTSEILIREFPGIGSYPIVRHQQWKEYQNYNKRSVNLWFGNGQMSLQNLYETVCKFRNTSSSTKIAVDLRDILLEYSPKDIQWRTYIVDKIDVARS
jgi:hypothetical protein